jgi:mono/diheme cytochrome c family protein
MKYPVILTIAGLIVVASAKPVAAQSGDESANEIQAFTVDSAIARTGQRLFNVRGCDGCHTVGKGDLAGPDLGGLLERRSVPWIKKWLQDPWGMIETDPTAKAMFRQYGFRMPNLKLKDDQIYALLHYIALQTQATQPGGATGK